MAEKKEPKRLIVGIKLGTSHTAMASGNEKRALFRSVVGYPRDLIGRHQWGGRIFVGEDALEKGRALDLHYPISEGSIDEIDPLNIDAAAALLTRVVSIADPAPDDCLCGIIGVPASVSQAKKRLLLEIAREVLHVAAVVSEPFLAGYHLSKLQNTIMVDIGSGTVDVCGLKGIIPGPDDQSTLYRAGDHVDRYLMNALMDRYPDLQLTPDVVRGIKERHAFVGTPAAPVIVKLREHGFPGTFEVTDMLRAACESIVPDIVEAIGAALSGFNIESYDRVLRNIYIAGGGARIRGIDKAIQDALNAYGKVRVRCVEEPESVCCLGALKLGTDVPTDQWKQFSAIDGLVL